MSSLSTDSYHLLDDKILGFNILIYISMGLLLCFGLIEIQKYYSILQNRLFDNPYHGKWYTLYVDKVSIVSETYILILGLWNIIL